MSKPDIIYGAALRQPNGHLIDDSILIGKTEDEQCEGLCRAHGTGQCAAICLSHSSWQTQDGKCPERKKVWAKEL